MNKYQYKSLFYAILLPVFILFLLFIYKQYTDFANRDAYKINKEICEQHTQQDSFAGIITCTFIDECNKATLTFVVNHQKHTFSYIVNDEDFERSISEGDSIVKKKGESVFYVYPKNNPDSVIILKFDCSLWNKMDSINAASPF